MKRIKVLLAKLGLDVHNRGIITVAKELGNAGMEIIYIGNALPNTIVQTALQEDVDIVGVSSLGGAHLTLGIPLLELSKKERISDMIFVIGGVFPPADAKKLKTAGFDAVFVTGTLGSDIVNTLKGLVNESIHKSI